MQKEVLRKKGKIYFYIYIQGCLEHRLWLFQCRFADYNQVNGKRKWILINISLIEVKNINYILVKRKKTEKGNIGYNILNRIKFNVWNLIKLNRKGRQKMTIWNDKKKLLI